MSSRSVTCPALIGLWVVALLGMPDTQAAQPAAPDFSIDIAVDCNRYIENAAQPGTGGSFLQEGIIYRPGTLAAHCPNGNGCGVNRDGTPEFPNAVIGRWRCWGSFVQAAAGSPPLYSTQIYELRYDNGDTTPGEHALVSHGPEWGNSDVPLKRVIAGGYGRFQAAYGAVAQSRIGFNQTQCENYTLDFKLRTQTRSWH
jgi:hypothetical protein